MKFFYIYVDLHITDVSFHVVRCLLYPVVRLSNLDDEHAKTRVRTWSLEADREYLLIFDDLWGTADSAVELPEIDPDSRRWRLTAMINTAQLNLTAPTTFVVEDMYWIGEVNESMLTDFLTVPQTH
ncbi:hypothetical protein [Mycobacterium uberis]|uniref:hypothetical protein n=1 Tax=Mycobacterium uberis TaxID=2162698 RepID=UPI001FB3DBF5|nr:hypothetical protein [Mycobacterium uberis]